MTTV
ncbi:hypothetical protein D047_0854A, partial [Vibrio parahaemolyticus VPTS-2010_2]|jgi:hypothetical protein